MFIPFNASQNTWEEARKKVRLHVRQDKADEPKVQIEETSSIVHQR